MMNSIITTIALNSVKQQLIALGMDSSIVNGEFFALNVTMLLKSKSVNAIVADFALSIGK